MWTTLVATATKDQFSSNIINSNLCSTRIIPDIVKKKVKEYENSKENEIRSIRVLYEGGIMSKKKYSTLRNCSDVAKENCSDVAKEAITNSKVEFMAECQIPKIVPYKKLMKIIQSINIGEVESLETFAGDLHVHVEPSVSGVYRPLKPFLLMLADLHLSIHAKQPCLHWFHEKTNVFYVAIGADGAPFGKDNTATGKSIMFY